MRKKLLILLACAIIFAGIPTAPSYAANPALVTTAGDTVPAAHSELSDKFSSASADAPEIALTAELYENILAVSIHTSLAPESGTYRLFLKEFVDNKLQTAKSCDLQYDEASDCYCTADGLDLSGLSDGKYRMSVASTVNSSYSNISFTYRNAVIEIKNGSAYFMTESNIKSSNTASINAMKNCGTSTFKDTSLSDMQYNFKDYSGKTATAEGPLTPSQQEYIKNKALEITKGAISDYDKVKKIYEYVAQNFYYDKDRPTSSKGALANPYLNLKAFVNQESNEYNASNGQVATNCVGFASLVCSMTRSLDIPTVFIKGKHHDRESSIWNDGQTYSDHHWVMCYVNGRWITVDANAGTPNQLNKDTKEYEHYGLTNYTFFDCSDDQLAQNCYITGYYKAPLTKLTSAVPSVSTYVYSGSQKKPSITAKAGTKTVSSTFLKVAYPSGMKNVGTYKIAVKGLAPYTGSVSCSFKINPKAASIKSLTAGKKQFKVKWNKITAQTTGYEIKYSTSKSFSSSKTSIVKSNSTYYRTIKSLKGGKKYYVKVRTYKTVNAKKNYSSWSAVKTVTTKR